MISPSVISAQCNVHFRRCGCVALTGDIHTSWANELTEKPCNPAGYDPATGRGVGGVEFVCLRQRGRREPVAAGGRSECRAAGGRAGGVNPPVPENPSNRITGT